MHRDVSSHVSRVLLVFATGLGVVAQEPISDKLEVTLPHATWVGSQSLAAGTYRIRQLPTASSPRLLEFSSNNGTKMETAITTIAAIGNNTQHDTSVTLEQIDGQYHLTHVWIAGKTYGYQLPIDGNRQLASKSTADTVTFAGNFVPNPAAPAPEQPREVAQATPPPAPEQAPAPVPEQPKQEPQPAAQAAATPPPAPEPQAPPAPQATPTPEPATSAPLVAAENGTPAMPATATHWPDLLLGGAVLLLLGLVIRPNSSHVS